MVVGSGKWWLEVAARLHGIVEVSFEQRNCYRENNVGMDEIEGSGGQPSWYGGKLCVLKT